MRIAGSLAPSLALVLALASVPVPLARAASLDESFGTAGLTFSPFAADEQPGGILTAPEGNLVMLGRTWGPSTSSILALQFDPGGGAVAAFGDPLDDVEGALVTAPGSASSGAFGGAIDAEGRILVAGYAFGDHGAGLAMDAVVLRLRPDGALDDSFGVEGTGVVLLDVFAFDDQANALAVLPDGRIVAVGRTTLGFDGGVVTQQAVAWLLDDSGALVSTLAFAVEGEQDELVAVAVDDAGRVLAAGNAVYDAGGRASVVAARLLVGAVGAAGVNDALALDPTWAGDGTGLYDPGAFFASAAATIHARPGGGAALGATVDNGAADPDFDLALVELGVDGALVRTTSASVHTLKGQPDPTRDNLRASALLDDGSALLAGDSDGKLIVVRVLADGAVDDAFGVAGLLEVAPCGTSARAASLALDDGGAVLAAGCFLDPFYADLVLARLTLDEAPPPGEGEGEPAEGEGEPGEGEGEPGEGEGEPGGGEPGEGGIAPSDVDPAAGGEGCGCTSLAGADAALWAVFALVFARARRSTARASHRPTRGLRARPGRRAR